MKKTLFFLISLLNGLTLYSQIYTLTGKVTDKATSEPLEATVFIRSLNLNAKTDSQGNYLLKVPQGEYTIGAFSLSKAIDSKVIRIQKDTVLDFVLEELIENLEEIEIREVVKPQQE